MYFEKLADLVMPELQSGRPIGTGDILTGPFAVVHNTVRNMGGFLAVEQDTVTLLESTAYRTLSTAYQYSFDEDAQTVRFYYPEVKSEFIIEPIVEQDMQTFYPHLTFKDLDEFKDYIYRVGVSILFDPTHEPTNYAILVDVDQNVLGLYTQDTKKGPLYRRENENWEMITQTSDSESFQNGTWVNVLSGAIELYDAKENDDKTSREIFREFDVEHKVYV